MASKHQRGKGSGSASAPPKFDNHRFVSVAAQECYKRMATRSLVPKWGLRSDQSKDGDIAAMIAERNWFTFTEKPDPVVIVVVKEFYANISEKLSNSAKRTSMVVTNCLRRVNVMSMLVSWAKDRIMKWSSASYVNRKQLGQCVNMEAWPSPIRSSVYMERIGMPLYAPNWCPTYMLAMSPKKGRCYYIL